MKAIQTCVSLLDNGGVANRPVAEPILHLVQSLMDNPRRRHSVQSCLVEFKFKELLLREVKKRKANGASWLTAVQVVELLRLFFDEQAPEEVEVFTSLLFDPVLEVRQVAVATLEKVSLKRSSALVEQLMARTLNEADPLARRSALLLLGKLARRSAEHMQPMVSAVERLMSVPEAGGQVAAATIIGVVAPHDASLNRFLVQILAQRQAHAGLVDAQLAAIGAIMDAGVAELSVVSALLALLAGEPGEDVRLAIHHCFKRLAIAPEVLLSVESVLFALVESASLPPRETALKLLFTLGAPVIRRCPREALVRAMSDEASSCRLQAFKCLELLLNDLKRTAAESFEARAREWLPVLGEGLADRNAAVVVQVLRALCALKRLAFPAMDLGLPLADLTDRFYGTQVVAPLVDKVLLLLHSRRFKYSKEIRTWVLAVLAETGQLREHLGSYKLMLNSDQISTLVEFAESFRGLGPQVLQYVPGLIAHIHAPGSPLVKHLVKLLQKATRTAPPSLIPTLFTAHTLSAMAKHKDAFARRVAAYLLGLLCVEQAEHLPLLLGLWADPNPRVKKQVIDSLGHLLRLRPSLLPQVEANGFLQDVDAVVMLRNLTLASGIVLRLNVRVARRAAEDEELEEETEGEDV